MVVSLVRRRLFVGAALSVALLGFSACATEAAAPVRTVQRVIVTFRPGAPDPRDAAFREQLAASARIARIDLLHEMSGNAWVMTLSCRADREGDCDDALQRLRATPWVATIEFDARVQHQ